MPDDVLSQYEDLNICLGCGSHAIVNLYVSKKSHQLVAVKRIPGSGRDFSVQGMNEVRVRERFPPHTHIVALREALTCTPDVYCILEYIPSTLQQYIKSTSRLKVRSLEEEALSFLHDVLQGLDHLHQYGIVHGDLKPSNILLAPNRYRGCVAKIGDFGSSVIFGNETIRSDNRSLRGTRRYHPPEVLLEHPGPARIHEIDIWAAGCIFWEILSGGPSFVDSRSCMAALSSIQNFMQNTQTGPPNGDFGPMSIALAGLKQSNACTKSAPFLDSLRPVTCSLLYALLALNPLDRISAREALCHSAFAEAYVTRSLPMPLPPAKVRRACEWIQRQSRLLITPSSNCFGHTPPPTRGMTDRTPPRKLFE